MLNAGVPLAEPPIRLEEAAQAVLGLLRPDLPLSRMVRWPCLGSGRVLTMSSDGKTFELLVSEATQSSGVGAALQRVQ